MGEPKLLKTAGGRTIFEISLGRHLESSLDAVAAVVPGWVEGFGTVMERSASGRVRFVVMDAPCRMSDSVKAGWEHLAGQDACDGIMISLADQPLVSAGTIDRLIRAFRETGGPVCVPVFEGRRGRPVVFSSVLAGEISLLEGDEGARSILKSHEDEIVEVPVESDGILRDVDRPEDLAELSARLEAGE